MSGSRRYIAAAALSFGSALVVIDGGIANVALPTIARDLGVEPSSAVSVVTVYQLVLVMSLLPLSALGERIGLRRLYQFGQLVFTIATLLCFFAKSLPFLLIIRAVQAVGAAACLSVSSAIIRQIYPANRLGAGLGINSVVVSSSAAFAPTLGGFVLAVAPWPWVFASAVPFAILSLLLGRYLPDPPGRDEPYDLLGAVMCAATFGLVIGGAESGVHGDSPVVSAAIVAAGLFLGTLFVRREVREPKPILPVDLLVLPLFALSTLAALAAFLAQMTLLVSLPFRLQGDFGFRPEEVGGVIAFWPLTTIFVAPLSGWLSDRIPAAVLGGVGMVIGAAGLLLVAFVPHDAGFGDFAWRLSVCGLGFGMFLSPNARLQIGAAPRDRTAAAGGMVSTVRLIGQTSGATLVAALLAMGLGAHRVPPLIGAGLALFAGLCSIARMRATVRKPDTGEVPHP